MFGDLLLSTLLGLSGLNIWQFAPPATLNPEPVPAAITTADVHTVTYEQTIPPGAMRVTVLSVEILPNCHTETDFFSIDIKKTGLGALENIDGIYITNNGVRTSAIRQFSANNNVVTLSLRNIDFEPCTAQELNIQVDFSEDMTPAALHTFTVESISASEPVVITYDTKSIESTIANQPIGSLEVVNLPVTSPIRYGNGRIIGRVRITNNDSKDQALHSITFTNSGNARNQDILNLRAVVRQTATTITNTSDSLVNDKAYLTFANNYVLQANSSIQLLLVGDVRVGSSTTIGFRVSEPSDLASITVNER